MTSKQSTIDYLLEQLADRNSVSSRKMFGEYAIYYDGKVAALVCDDQLYVKPTEAGRVFIGQIVEGQPYPGAKPHFLISADRWEDAEWLTQLLRVTAAALPLPKAKRGA